ncbi:MAG: hypothetical protein H0T46_36050 [Deltaproteobacteria bacterium]|nr:hypothetical protein [Deltaproteobacteria bacterium]
MRRLALLLLVVACSKESSKPSTGSSSSPPPSPAPAPAVAPAPAAPACDLTGTYRLRYHSNGSEGWWLRLTVVGKDVKLGDYLRMLGLDEASPVTTVLDDKACTLTITKATKQAGDLKIALAIDGSKVTGTVTRTANAGNDGATTPIAGLRETAPPKIPACIRPGIYELRVANVKKWITEGSPRMGTCKSMQHMALTHVRVQLLGDTLYIDEGSSGPPYQQGFGRAEVTRTSECEATLVLGVQDFDLTESKITFAGDKITGKTTAFKYEIFEDGTDGENLWTCSTKEGDVIGTRVGDD